MERARRDALRSGPSEVSLGEEKDRDVPHRACRGHVCEVESQERAKGLRGRTYLGSLDSV